MMSSSPCPSIHAYAKFSPLLLGLLLSIEDDSPTKGHREIRHDLHLGYLSETVCDHGPTMHPINPYICFSAPLTLAAAR